MATAPLPPSQPESSIAQQSPPLSESERVINTFIAPSKTFTDLRRSASWWLPFLIVVFFSYLFIYSMDRQVGFDQINKNEITRSPRRTEQLDRLPPEQRAQQMKIAAVATKWISYGSPVVLLVFYLITSAVLMVIFKIGFSVETPFKVFWAIVVFSGLPGILRAVLAVVSLFSGVDPESFNVNNPVATNPAYFMDSMGNKFLYGMASSLDVFIWWGIVLMGIGVACNSKVKRSTAIIVIGVAYLIYKLATSGLAAVLS